MKLLTLTFRYYAGLAGVLWLLSVPVSFWQIRRLVIQDLDEKLLTRKTEIARLLATDADNLLARYLPRTDPSVRLELVPVPAIDNQKTTEYQLIPDRLYDTTYFQRTEREWEPHRELATSLLAGNRHYRLWVRQSLVEEEDFISTITGLQTGVFLLLLLGLGLINRQLTRQLWHPFTDALHRIRRFRLETDATPEWLPTRVNEFQELQTGLTTLIRRSQQAYNSQKQFAENASHELQTPLAVIAAELEVLFQSENLPDADLAHVQRATEATARLAHINRALLLLTQIENRQFGESQPVDIGAVLNRLVTANAEFISHKQLILTYEPVADPIVPMNPYLAEVLLGNLLRNAIRHTPAGGRIRCRVMPDAVTISNTGEPLPFAPDTLFARFVKNPALPEATGLGLAIARQIADRYGLSLTYTYDAQAGEHTFRLGLTTGPERTDRWNQS